MGNRRDVDTGAARKRESNLEKGHWTVCLGERCKEGCPMARNGALSKGEAHENH